MNNGSLPPPTQSLPLGGPTLVPLVPPPLFGVMLPPVFTRRPEPEPRPAQAIAVRERRGFFQPDFSDLRMCFRQVSTGRVAADGQPIKDLVQVPCPPRPEPPKKKGWCTIL